jgi:hypothetical protein
MAMRVTRGTRAARPARHPQPGRPEPDRTIERLQMRERARTARRARQARSRAGHDARLEAGAPLAATAAASRSPWPRGIAARTPASHRARSGSRWLATASAVAAQ